MSKTEKDLQDAFAGESQANRKYLAFAKKADREGYAGAAKLFRAAAEAETVHAHNHLKQLDGIKSTKENLEAAINGESFEFQEMYPGMIKGAEEEGNKGHYAVSSMQMKWKRSMQSFTGRPLKISAVMKRRTTMYARFAVTLLMEKRLINVLFAVRKKSRSGKLIKFYFLKQYILQLRLRDS